MKQFAFRKNCQELQAGTFAKWFTMGEDLCLYQGDINENQNPNGKGITLEPNGGIEIGYYKDGKRHGSFISIEEDGSYEEADFKNGHR